MSTGRFRNGQGAIIFSLQGNARRRGPPNKCAGSLYSKDHFHKFFMGEAPNFLSAEKGKSSAVRAMRVLG